MVKIPFTSEDEGWFPDPPGISFDAALLAGTLGVARRTVAAREAVTLGTRLVRRPRALAGPLAKLAGESARIATGRSKIDPGRRDRRYSDAVWRGNPLFRALAQEHVALGAAVEAVLDGAELDPADDYRVRLMAINLIAGLAPANWPWSNPAAWKAVVDTGGGSLVTGPRRLVEDLSRPPRLPARSASHQFKLGEELAATPGAVVLRTPMFELLQYDPVTPDVTREPLLIVPSLVNKYYLTDLAPGRSLVEHAVKAGVQVFHISWFNPGKKHRDFDLDTYIAAIVEALDAVRAITGEARAHTLGVCAGGQLLAIALAHLAALGRQDEVASVSMTVAVLDHSEPASPTGLMDRGSAARAIAKVRRDGIVDGRRLQAALAWLRPIDSVWWAWVQRYLLVADLPRMDLFYWSEDTTNLPAGLVVDLIDLSLENRLTVPGSLTVLGTPIDLREVRMPGYVIAGLTDNLTAWRSCYQTTRMLGSRCAFVLVNGGHLQAILRPPGGRSAGFRTAPSTPADPDAWLERSKLHDSSWWDHWLAWLDRRSDGRRPAPEAPGSDAFAPVGPAPGRYVMRRFD